MTVTFAEPLKIYVLYGSQTGNSEQAAQDIASQLPSQVNALLQQQSSKSKVSITTECLQLDDFLELHHGQWTPFVIIVTSSYGVGQAPLGCYRFRDLCDYFLQQTTPSKNDPTTRHLLDGVSYALCGLGDSKYTTFFKNPTIIDKALTSVGAKRIAILGKADASGKQHEPLTNAVKRQQLDDGTIPQSAVIQAWMEQLWPALATAIDKYCQQKQDQQPEDVQKTTFRFKHMQLETIRVCTNINPDYQPPKWYVRQLKQQQKKSSILVPIIMTIWIVVMIFVYHYIYTYSFNASAGARKQMTTGMMGEEEVPETTGQEDVQTEL